MSKGMKLLAALGIVVLIVVGVAVWLWWIEMRPSDFWKTPTTVLDDAVFAAQQSDVDEFRRNFTKATREEMDKVHEFNTNRPPDEIDPELMWTWQTLMSRMAVEGGFTVVEEPDLYDRWTKDKSKVKITFEGRDKIYSFEKQGGAWRINLLDSDPGFSDARACIRDRAVCPIKKKKPADD
ncbi:MAG: hypothetical protein RBU37_04545 [Myxococcota bacterium]|jgi:hypothetical protein|nr:hypothetical protein [Myxococcota bacterium]